MNNKDICSNGSLRESVAIFIDQNPILTKYKNEKYYELEDALVDFVEEQVDKARKKIYLVVFDWCNGVSDAIEIYPFNTYASAVEKFNALIQAEKNTEISWVGELLDKNGNLVEGVTLEEVQPNLETEKPCYWDVTDNWDKYSNISIKTLEVE